ncbi:MAG: hypothetical protein JO247_12175, partial [Chloroflexi bacterium]|nr:hypothetical protein [Chloroflexota bacterium]
MAALVLLLAVVIAVGPLTGAYRLFAVRSASMNPAIPAGALVVVRSVHGSEL